MSADGASDVTVLFAVAGGVWFAVAVGFYIWYALALSMVFPRVHVESWRAWVPVLSDAEILRLGGFSPWLVILYFIPVVNIYGLVLRAIAATRVHMRFGYAVGMTVLAILLPPVWATILAWGRGTVGTGEPQVAPASAGLQVTGPLAQTKVPADPTPQHTSAVPRTVAQPGEPGRQQQGQQQAAPGLIAPPPGWYGNTASAAGGSGTAQPGFTVERAVPPTSGAAAAEQPAVQRPVFQPPAFQPPAPVVPPYAAPPAPPSPAPMPAAQTAGDAGAVPPAQAAPTVSPESFAPVAGPGVPVSPPPAQVRTTFTPPDVSEPATDTGTVVVQRPESPVDDSEDDETVIVPRKRTPRWRLETDEGEQLDLTADEIVLGRRPSGADVDVQYLALRDGTKTLSKLHARLSCHDDTWSITDLHSTNGVILIDANGQEEPLEAGETAPVTDRLLLGKVGVRIVRVGS